MKKQQIIVIPAYKPSKEILIFVDELKEIFETIVIVDDGGKEAYEHIFEQLRLKGCTVLTHYVNMGKGRALKTAFNYCMSLGEVVNNGVITVDADGQHKTSDIIKIAEAMEKNKMAVVLGCRDFGKGNVPFRSYWGNNISKVVYRWLCGIAVSDTQTGLRGIPACFLPTCCVGNGEKYEYETNMLIDMNEGMYPVIEIPIETVYENNNESSHFNPIKDSIKIYSVILRNCMPSIISTLIDFCVFILMLSFNDSILIATYISRAVSCIINLLINRKVVIGKKGNKIAQYTKYIVWVLVSGTISGFGIAYIFEVFSRISPVFIKIPIEIVLYIVQRLLVIKK